MAAWAALLALVLAGQGLAQDQPPPDQPPPDQQQPDQPSLTTGVSISNIEPGFSDGAYNLVRPDSYAPINVLIRNRTGALFTGKIQVLSRDRDGETVIHELAGFGVQSGALEDKRFGFFARNPGMYNAATELVVRLLDDRDRLIHAETAALEYIKESEHLVLDISPLSIKPAIQAALADPNDTQRFRGSVRTASMRPDQMPQFWQELEAVDVIVCDEPDGAGLRQEDLSVLAHWVRQGGSLVLGPGSLQSLAESDLGRMLPAKSAAAQPLPRGRTRLEGLNTSLALDLLREAGVWELQSAADATVLLSLPRSAGGKPVLVRRRAGTGSIIQSGISLRLLLDKSSEEGLKPGMGPRLKPEIFGVRTLDVVEEKQVGGGFGWGVNWPRQRGPSDLVEGEADFRATGTVLATLLMLLIVVYGLAATLGTWIVLKRRNLAQHSWLAFAGVAVVGSVGAAMLVQGARGISADVKQHSFIDMDGATGMASVRTFFGLKMPYDARVDIGLTAVGYDDLPPDQRKAAYIRPASNMERSTGEPFAVKRDYTIRYGDDSLAGVPVRATVKQFESYWCGPVRGTILASLTARADGKLAAGSSITNHTDLDLRECYLLYARTDSLSRNVREKLIDVVRIDNLLHGTSRSDLERLTASGTLQLDNAAESYLRNLPMEMPGRRGMSNYERQVNSTLSERLLAAAMISVLSDLPSVGASGMMQMQGMGGDSKLKPYTELPREGARWLDLRNVLDGRHALLVGLVDAAGPLRLKVNGDPIQPSSGECIVRVVLPFTRPAQEPTVTDDTQAN